MCWIKQGIINIERAVVCNVSLDRSWLYRRVHVIKKRRTLRTETYALDHNWCQHYTSLNSIQLFMRTKRTSEQWPLGQLPIYLLVSIYKTYRVLFGWAMGVETVMQSIASVSSYRGTKVAICLVRGVSATYSSSPSWLLGGKENFSSWPAQG